MKIIFLDKDGVVNSDKYFDSIKGKEVSDLEYDVDLKTIDMLEKIVSETGSKIVVTGDATQIDLPDGKKSGLVEVIKILNTRPSGSSFVKRYVIPTESRFVIHNA